MRQKLWCTGFNEFKRLVKTNNWDSCLPEDIAIISIINGKDCGNPEEYHILSDSDRVLNLEFDDVSPEAFGLSDDSERMKYSEDTVLEFFTDFQAKDVIDFVENNLNKNFFIHCSAGVSRSQAVTKFILLNYSDRDWELNSNNPIMFPNGFVYQKLCKVKRERDEKRS
jgi:predicted protein tyrosine phosphatase